MTSKARGSGESQHSHFEYGSTHGGWERNGQTDFAITTVNVPDRLDTMEVRSRAAADDAAPRVDRFHRADLIRWSGWLAGLVFVGAVLWGAMRVIEPIRQAISPTGVGARMSQALGVPVTVRDTEIRFLPSPRLVITGLIAQSGFRLPEISVHFNWRDALQGLRAAKWVLGEAQVAPIKLTGPEALAVLQSIRGASGLPAPVTTVRFQSVEFTDLVLLPGRFEAVVRRGTSQRDFNALSLKRLDSTSPLDIEITAPVSPEAPARFALFARDWSAPVGPAIRWTEATAQGAFRADEVICDSYSVGTRFGNLNGAGRLARADGGWRLTGNVKGADLSIEGLLRFLSGAGPSDDQTSRYVSPIKGTARFDLAAGGRGGTVEEALRKATVGGPVVVVSALIEGTNFGVAATHGVQPAGGKTRFTDLGFDFYGSAHGAALRGIVGRAGSLKVSGSVSVARNLAVNGALRSDVASPRGVASAQIGVGGTAQAPTFR